jgi:hypothetical protein
VIFHSYVSLPEGRIHQSIIFTRELDQTITVFDIRRSAFSLQKSW